MIRYHITLGALTTAGGVVTQASGIGSIDDKQVVLEGDIIVCRTCKSTGYVLCVGPRIPEFWGDGVGKQVALEHDLCACKCNPPPTLIANQSLSYQTIEGQAMALGSTWGPTVESAPLTQHGPQTDYDEHFQLIDKRTGKLLEDWGYRIEAPDRTAEGATDSAGKTGLVGSDAPEDAVFEYAHQTQIGV